MTTHNPGDNADETESRPQSPRPTAGELLARAMRLRCPRCGEGRLFSGWAAMPERCSVCGLKYERAPGYFLGSTYINYGLTAVVLIAAYFLFHDGFGMTNQQLAGPMVGVCVVFPVLAFRHARALWLAFDCHFDASILSGEGE
ncbi:MAG: DUF983 domain-containing protein [Planctomycetota bacterium]|nr:MAG: DUF983 domain-containing protein [Planctomycetota bacterium]REJ88849.1 MAG: DUF983 domain-containing protein [Planctomycetota bacterium]REK25205.1 MAG: DUF983 domain-containing protein [Planctomycetota bacterium]REK32105.1 MAG: DUF983 domain-containing protein [Planctomycetota bacterium]